MTHNNNGTGHQFPATVADKLKPHNVEAEEAFLGAVLIDPDVVILTASLGLKGSDFFIERHGWIWQAAQDLWAKNAPIDLISLTDELERRGQLNEIGGSGYITGLINQTPSSSGHDYYAGIIKRTSTLRQLINAAGQISQLAYRDTLDADEAIQKATDILFEVSKQNIQERNRSMNQIADAFLDRIEQIHNSPHGITGLPTGLVELDKLLGGLQRSDLIVLAGRPGMGKSAMALQIALEAAKNYNARSLIFSREMSDESLFQRMVSYESGIDVKRLRTGQIKDEEYSAMLEATSKLASLPFVIDGDTATPEAMRARAIIEKERYGLDLVVVDYIQRVDTADGRKYQNKVAEIGAISGMLKRLAKDLNVPVLAISSLSRQCERRDNKRPLLSDLRESGDIEYDADVVMFVYRDEVYRPNTDFPNVAEIIVSKQKQGPLGVLSLYFEKQLTKFIDLETRREPVDWVK
jgi:replicative DNA helicase